jgi:hypothetical protein
MEFIFYSKPGCPQCSVLKKKMDTAGIQYTHYEDVEAIMALGYKGAPLLRIINSDTESFYCGPEAIKWITNWIKEHPNGN